jgi:hypothetical protein
MITTTEWMVNGLGKKNMSVIEQNEEEAEKCSQSMDLHS